jgi:hypothetical protein
VAEWELALDHYRETLAAGWGTDAAFAGATDALRMQIEWVVTNIVRERKRLASSMEADAKRHRVEGNGERAADCYEAAAAHLTKARRLAAEYDTGDEAALDRRASRLEAACRDV